MKLEKYLPNMSDEGKPGIINLFLKSRNSTDTVRKNTNRQSAEKGQTKKTKCRVTLSPVSSAQSKLASLVK